MKKVHLSFLTMCVLLLTLSSCATIFSGVKAKITLKDPQQKQPVDITTDVKHYDNVTLPYKVKIKGVYNENIPDDFQ